MAIVPDCYGMNHVTKYTVKHVLSGHTKIDKAMILVANGSSVKVESIAPLCNTFDLQLAIIGLEN